MSVSERSGFPLLAYIVIGVLAVFGAFSVLRFVTGIVSSLFGIAFIVLVIWMIFKVLGAVKERSA